MTLAVDFDLLRQELSYHIVDGPQERYQLDWPGKRAAGFAANAPIAKTLRPVREESVDFDTTKNLFIEGDNLDALKLLQESYLGKIKLIYIDPPYNTGNDFVYEHDFAESSAEYLQRSGQKSNAGQRLVANTEANGRFHSDWLSLMYPRLKLARNLLADSGTIFVSINDVEVAHLRRLLDEVCGADNFVATVVWKNATDNNPTRVAVEHEYVLVYARRLESVASVWKSSDSAARDLLVTVGDELIRSVEDPKEQQRTYTSWFRAHRAVLGPLDRYKYIDEVGVYTGSQTVHNPRKEGYRYDVIHPTTGRSCRQPLLGYRFPDATMQELLASGRLSFGDDENKIIELKVYAKDCEQKLSSVIELDGRIGANEPKSFFPGTTQVFTNPKPVSLLRDLMSVVVSDGDVVLDFFTGSGSVAQAVMEMNAGDREHRQFVAVQLPEPTPNSSSTRNAGYSTIADLCKDRIRRAAASVGTAAASGVGLDTGFRVLRVDTTNLADVLRVPDAIGRGELNVYANSVKSGRTGEDLVFQVLLDWGLALSLDISREEVSGSEVFVVDGGALLACFGDEITPAVVKSMAERHPLRAVFKDSGSVDDAARINAEQIFREVSPETEVRTI